jgi:hypothetical protein
VIPFAALIYDGRIRLTQLASSGCLNKRRLNPGEGNAQRCNGTAMQIPCCPPLRAAVARQWELFGDIISAETGG